MPTLDQYAYNVRNIARAGQGDSDDEKLNIKQVKFWINGYRSAGMFQATDFGKDIHPQLFQDLGVIPLEEVDKADSSCPDVKWGCTIKKIKIPKLIDFPELRALNFVGLIDKQTDFIINSPSAAHHKQDTKFGNLKTRVYPIGEYLYFMLTPEMGMLDYVNVRGVFESPEDVFTYPTKGCEQRCYDSSTDEYPMQSRLYEFVLQRILGNELNWNQQAVNDELNNARLDNAKIG